jgi:hypothetical protein
MKKKLPLLYTLLISLVALVVAVIALYQAKTARSLALSDLVVEENNSLITPLYDEQTNSWSHLAIYEISVTNLAGPPLQWISLQPSAGPADFLVALKGGQVVAPSLACQVFACEPTLSQIQANPKLIRELANTPLSRAIPVRCSLAPGESKTIRMAVRVQAYDSRQQPLADMVLVSFDLTFDHERNYVFRRGFPIQAVELK